MKLGFDELEHNVFGHFRGHDAIGVFECAGRVELAIRCDGERVPATVMRQRDGRDSAILGAIYGGICTPSEAAAVSVFYAAFVGLFVYKKINFKDCVQIFVKTCCTAGVCGFMVFCVSMVSRIFMVENLNGAVEALLNAMGGNRYVILLCVNILLILFGMFLDDSSAMYICAPILTPVLANFGIDPVHFAAIMIVNLGLGCITPPCASVLFMGARVGKSSLTKMLPSTYSLILFVWLPMLAILTLFPDVALWLPRVMLGYGA